MTPALPPNSSVTFFWPALLFSIQPTAPLPVKLIIRTRGSVTIISVSGPQAFNMLKACGGKPASSTISARITVESGVFSAGLMMMGLPAAIAGPILWQARLIG